MLYRTLKRLMERGQTQGLGEKLDVFFAADKLREFGVEVKLGIFGADMKIEQLNDGPVTILLESEADA